jgi:hypothetical protein
MLCRDLDKAEAAAKEIRYSNGRSRVNYYESHVQSIVERRQEPLWLLNDLTWPP